MPLLSPQDQAQLQDIFRQELVNDVDILLFTQRETRIAIPGFEQLAQRCAEANQIMQEVSALSDKIHLEVFDYRMDTEKLKEHGVERVPTVVIGSDGTSPVRFVGVPSGYEFSTLVQDIVDLSTNAIALSEDTQTSLKELQEDVHIQVFVTPT